MSSVSKIHQGISHEPRLQLMSLNIWGGRLLDSLLEFIKSHQNIDIFCFQEVYSQTHQNITPTPHDPICLNIYERIGDILPNHHAFFRPIIEGVYGLSIFVRKDCHVLEEGWDWIYKNMHYSGCDPSHSRIMQWIKVAIESREIAIINVHGLWNGQGKTDSPQRILQSNIIKEFARGLSIPAILCGDFNLIPNTKSIEILEDGMQNLIKRYNILSTRSDIYKKPERYADYIFMPKELEVIEFKIFKNEVSDHLPLYVEFT